MQFLYSEQSGNERVVLKGEDFNYIVKVRRHKVGQQIVFRSLEEGDKAYIYEIENIEPKKVILSFVQMKNDPVGAKKSLHLGWCVVDVKSIEKALVMLNEIGVEKISFIYCERSQRNIKLNFERFYKLLQSSSMQCGRSRPMSLELVKDLDTFLQKNPECAVIDFSKESVQAETVHSSFLVGCEGGFSENERELFKNRAMKVLGFDTKTVLRSETAVVSLASKILL